MLTEVSVFPLAKGEQASESAQFFFGAINSTSKAGFPWSLVQSGEARLSRSWSFPLFVVLVLTIVLFVLKLLLSQFITNPADIDVFKIRGRRGCCDTCNGTQQRVVVSEGEQNQMKPAFTELALKKIIRVGSGKEMISDSEIEQGWTIVRDRATQILYKAKCWASDGVSRTSGLPHKTGDVMRVYDDISQTRLATYSINANPRYRAAIRGLHLKQKRTDEFVEHFDNVSGLSLSTSQKHLGWTSVLQRNGIKEDDEANKKWSKKRR